MKLTHDLPKRIKSAQMFCNFFFLEISSSAQHWIDLAIQSTKKKKKTGVSGTAGQDHQEPAALKTFVFVF